MSQSVEASGYSTRAGQVRLIRRDIVLSPAAINTITAAAQIFAIVGVLATDLLAAVNKPTDQAGIVLVPQRVSSAGNVEFKGINPTAGNVTPTAAEIYSILLAREATPTT